jgi:hypothetical protein
MRGNMPRSRRSATVGAYPAAKSAAVFDGTDDAAPREVGTTSVKPRSSGWPPRGRKVKGMTTALALLVALSVSLTAALVLYVENLRWLLARSPISRSRLALALVATPWLSWREGRRFLPVALVLASLTYASLWLSVALGSGP